MALLPIIKSKTSDGEIFGQDIGSGADAAVVLFPPPPPPPPPTGEPTVIPPLAEPDPSIYPLSLGLFTEDLYRALLPLAYADPSLGYPLLKYILSSAYNLDEITRWVRDQGEQPGWALFMDPDQAPTVALRWLGQLVGTYVGAKTPFETTAEWDAAARAQIKDLSNFRRGTVQTIINTTKQFLTGNKNVFLTERDTSPYHYSISVYDSEAPADTTALVAALQAAKPAGLQFTFQVVPGQTYDQLEAGHADYDAVESAYPDYIAVREDEV